MKAALSVLSAILVAILCNAPTAHAQWTVKLIQNTDFFKPSYYDTETRTTTAEDRVSVRFSLAVQHTGKRLAHELEVFVPEINKAAGDVKFPFNGYTLRNDRYYSTEVNSYSLRYEVSKNVVEFANICRFGVGIAFNPYYVKTEYTSAMPVFYYDHQRHYFGASLNVVPRFAVQFSKRFGAEISVPFKLFDIWGESLLIGNPSIPVNQQRQDTEWNHSFFMTAYTVRAALTYTF